MPNFLRYANLVVLAVDARIRCVDAILDGDLVTTLKESNPA
jgi:hypothetical protein